MARITIRHLDDEVKTQLRVRASANGRSIEEEARIILREVVGREAEPENLASVEFRSLPAADFRIIPAAGGGGFPDYL